MKADIMLAEPELSITEIAMRSGFNSLSTFNRVFKAHHNCTPMEYRRHYQVGEEMPPIQENDPDDQEMDDLDGFYEDASDDLCDDGSEN